MIETLNQLPNECFTTFLVVMLIVVAVVELTTPKAVGPVTAFINSIGSCFTVMTVILILIGLAMIAIGTNH